MAESLLDLDELLQSWLIALRGERKSPETLKAYKTGVRAFLNFCSEQDIPPALTKSTVVAFMASIADQEAATARLRLTALKRFARWLAEEEDFVPDGVLAVRAPKLDQRVVNHFSDREVKALLKACEGQDWRDKRDRALVAMLTETGMRAEEVLGLTVDDVSIAGCSAIVRRGKGAKGRKAKFSNQTAATLDRWLRARRKAGHGDGPVWIGAAGRALSYSGLKYTLGKRAERGGVPDFQLHKFRHSAAVSWLRAGGSENGLMAQAGWQSRHMIDRYVKSASEELAADEFDRLGLGVDS